MLKVLWGDGAAFQASIGTVSFSISLFLELDHC